MKAEMAAASCSTAEVSRIPDAKSASRLSPGKTPGDRLSQSAGECASVSRQRHLAGGRQHQHLSGSRLQALDGVVRLHRRPASLRLSGGGIGETSARQRWSGSGGASSRAGAVEPMKAMILAAGLGTRLRPLTDDRPKALVEISGHTLLEITLSRLRKFGVHEVIINVHHF